MKTKTATMLFTTILCSVFMMSVFAQGDKESRPSPPATAMGKIGKANVTISYSSPSVKGRKIYGTDLVPYGKVWRAGANEATIFQTDAELTIGGKKLPAGKYSLFAIAGEKEWTFILNSETGQSGIKRSGEANLDRAKDVATVTAKPKKSSSFNEKLVYTIENNGFTMKWENIEVPVAVK